MAVDVIVNPKFAVGEVLGKSLTIWIKNLLPFGVLGIVFNIPLAVGFYLLFEEIIRQPGPIGFDSLPPGFLWGIFAVIFVAIAGYQLLIAAIAFGVITYLRGRPVHISACVAQAFKHVVPVLLIGLFGASLTWLASLLLVIPGIIVMLNFWVAVPVCVAEGLGASASLSRSTSLARGHRWQILGIVLVTVVIAAVAQQAFGYLTRFLPVTSSVSTVIAVLAIVTTVSQAVFTTLIAAVAACVYYYLRVTKEGADIDQIAAVFD